MRSLLLACLSFFCIYSFGQQYPVKSYTVTEGLIQSQVTALAQDHRGNIWIGTKGGVSVFDGDHFQNYGPDSLLTGAVKDIEEDPSGNIWIATTDGLIKYDFTRFYRYDFSDSLVLSSITIDDQGIVWMNTRSLNHLGLYRFDGKECKKVDTGITFTDREYYVDMEYDPIYDRILIASIGRGLIEYKEGNFSIISDDSLVISRVILKDSICYFKSDSTIFQLKGTEVTPYYKLPFKLTYRLDIDQEGNIMTWEDDLLRRISPDGQVDTYDIPSETVVQLIVDREGFTWLGTENGVRLIGNKAFTNYTKEDGIISNVWTVVEDNNHHFWFGGFGAGLQKFDGTRFVSQAKNYSHLYGRNNFHFGAIKDSKGHLLFPTDQKVLKYDGTAFSILPGSDVELYRDSTNTRGAILYIYEDTIEQTLLLGRAGLQILDKEKEIAFYDRRDDLGIKSYVTAINKDKNSDYWIGHHKGVSHFDRQNDTFINYYQDSIHHLPSEGVYAIFRDYKDNLWLGSKNGLLLYDYSTEQFRVVGQDCYDGGIAFIESVDSSYLLLGTGISVALFDLQQFYKNETANFYFFNRKNGFTGGSVGMNAILKDSKGKFWIPTSSLTTQFDPKQIRLQDRTIVKPHIISANIPDSDFENGWRDILVKDRKIVLPKNQNNLKVEFKAVSFSDPNIKYRYRLLRNEKTYFDWSQPSERTYAIFSSLPKGNYRFEVSTACCFKEQQVNSFAFRISINWQKLVIYLSIIIALLLIGILFLVAKTRRSKMEREKLMLKNNILSLSKEKLVLKNDNLKLYALQSQMNPHFIANALNSVQTLLLAGDKRQALDYLPRLAELIRYSMNSSKSQTISIDAEINFIKLYLELQELRFSKFDYTLPNADPKNKNSFQFQIPTMLLQPFVENAISHGLLPKDSRGILRISIEEQAHQFLFIIEDNGIGRVEAQNRKNSRKSKSEFKVHSTQIIMDRISILKKLKRFYIDVETIDLYSADNRPQGTRVILSILKNHIENDESHNNR